MAHPPAPDPHRAWPQHLRAGSIAVVAVGSAAITSVTLTELIEVTPFALFHLAVLVAAVLGGALGGWVAVALAVAVGFVWLVMPTMGTPDQLGAVVSLLVSGGVASAIVVLVGRIRAATVDARERRIELERRNRLYDALSQVNQAIVLSESEGALFDRVCLALVERGGFRMAWIGRFDEAQRALVPVARHGDGSDDLVGLTVSTDVRPDGGAPSATAFREGRTTVVHDLAAIPWRSAALARGQRSCAALPIRVAGEPVGVLSVYADQEGSFRDAEVQLLEEAASDLSHGLDRIAGRARRERAEQEALRERQLVDVVFDSVPGVVYLYDEERRFRRWNRTFLEVTGTTEQELEGMDPLDFFGGSDRDLVAERVDAVFAHGEASVEAGFVSRDGTVRPYYFTGRRVMLDDRPHLVGMGIDLSERVAAVEELRRSEERYHSTLDSIMEGCQIIGSDWRYLYLNDAAAAHNRRPRDELLGRTMQECWPGIEATPVHALLRRTMETRLPTHDEVEFRFADGAVAWFDVRAQPVPEGVFVLSIDVTERRRAQAAARDLALQFEVVVEHLREGLVITDATREDAHWNPAALALLGFVEASGGRRRTEDFQPLFEVSTLEGESLDARDWPSQRVRRGETFLDLELVIRRLDRPWERIISFSGAQVTYADGRGLGFVTLQDMTARKAAERALIQANETLEQTVEERTAELRAALVQAEAADRIKSAFLATMSHELRTPLNSILGFTGILLQGLAGPLAAEQEKQLSMVRGSARHLLDLINDVLDISRIEAGQLEVRAEPMDLREAVEGAIAAVQPMADAKDLRVVTTLPDTLPAMRSDPRRVRQILLNLLNNAVKFTERGSIGITVEAGPGIRSSGGAPAVRLRVDDTGVGIKEDDLATLFQPFRQLDSGISRQHEGTGLGLAISRRLAVLLGGDIIAESRWGTGSTFTVTLPIETEP